jgi:hypothetical protein
MPFRFSLIYILVALPALSFSQSAHHKYIGVIDVDKVGKFIYQLEYTVDGNKLTGSSVTGAGSKNETKAFIKGSVSQSGAVSFSETKILKTAIKKTDISFCFVNATLASRQQAGLDILEGKFEGKDRKGEACGTGRIQLVKKVEKITDSLKTSVKAALDSAIQKGKEAAVIPLKNTALNKIYTTEKSVRIRVYDSGYIDGDEVRIKYNNTTLVSKYILSKEGKEFLLEINPSIENYLEISTLNEGKSAPNTATLDIITGRGVDTYQLTAPANTDVRLQLIPR